MWCPGRGRLCCVREVFLREGRTDSPLRAAAACRFSVMLPLAPPTSCLQPRLTQLARVWRAFGKGNCSIAPHEPKVPAARWRPPRVREDPAVLDSLIDSATVPDRSPMISPFYKAAAWRLAKLVLKTNPKLHCRGRSQRPGVRVVRDVVLPTLPRPIHPSPPGIRRSALEMGLVLRIHRLKCWPLADAKP